MARHAGKLAAALAAGASVIGIDTPARMLQAARKRAGSRVVHPGGRLTIVELGRLAGWDPGSAARPCSAPRSSP